MADETPAAPAAEPAAPTAPPVERPAPRPGFDFIPELVAGAAGLSKGLLSAYGSALGRYRDGIFRFGLLGLGGAGYLFRWDSDVTYTLLAVGTYDLMAQVAPAIQGKSIKVLAADVAQPRARVQAPEQATLSRVSGCTSCAAGNGHAPKAAALVAPRLQDTAQGVL